MANLTMSLTEQVSVAGRTYSNNVTVTGNIVINAEPNVLAAQAGVVTSGGTTTSASLTLGASHGIITGQKVDIYWTGGRLLGATVGTVSGTTVPITASGTFEDGASAFPANATAIVVSPLVTETVGWVGNNMQGIVASMAGASPFVGTVTFYASGTVLLQVLLQATGSWNWILNSGWTNPLAGVSVTSVTFSHNETDAAVALRLGVLNS